MNTRWLGLLVVIVAVFGVFGAERSVTEQPRDETTRAAEAVAQRVGCLDCHSVDKKKVGPAFRDVAARYKSDPDARADLIRKIKSGGKGNWVETTGGKSMPAHSALASEAEFSQLVGWILSRQ